MNSFSHHVIRRADVTVTREGKAIKIEVKSHPAERITIEIENGTLTIRDTQDGALQGNPLRPKPTRITL